MRIVDLYYTIEPLTIDGLPTHIICPVPPLTTKVSGDAHIFYKGRFVAAVISDLCFPPHVTIKGWTWQQLIQMLDQRIKKSQ